jgi:hypothetical protein
MPSVSPPPRTTHTAPPNALQAAPPDVRALVARLGLGDDIARAESLANDCFPPDSVVTVEKVCDRESDAEWLAVRVAVRATPDDVAAAFQRWLREWLDSASHAAVDAVALTFAVI